MTPGTVIILNGASSSGKTTLLHALQNRLTEPYLEAGIDKFIYMLPHRWLERPLWDDVLGLATEGGQMGQRLVHGMHTSVAVMAQAGLNVLVDHVLVEPGWAAECATLLGDMHCYLIAVRCPLEVLEQRECARINRTLGQARAQFEKVHRYCRYDFEVDTSQYTPEVCAKLIEDFITANPRPLALQWMRYETIK